MIRAVSPKSKYILVTQHKGLSKQYLKEVSNLERGNSLSDIAISYTFQQVKCNFVRNNSTSTNIYTVYSVYTVYSIIPAESCINIPCVYQWLCQMIFLPSKSS